MGTIKQTQRTVIGLSKKLKPITQKQMDWGFNKLFDFQYTISRNRTYCLECGHKWKLDNHKKVVCPSCHKKLISTLPTQNKKLLFYYAILTTTNDWQVIRICQISKTSKLNSKPTFHCSEVMQHWINSDGEFHSLQKECFHRTMYYDQFNFETNLDFRCQSERWGFRNSIHPDEFYPYKRILPILKRNGFKGDFHNITPYKLLTSILNSHMTETLLKINNIEMLSYCINDSSAKVNRFWKSILIAEKNHYNIADLNDWFDYLHLLKEFNMDLKSPKYVCPDDFELAHNRMIKKRMKMIEKRDAHQRRKDHDKYQIIYESEKSKFFDMFFTDGEIEIQPLKSIDEFYEHAKILHHCIYSNSYWEETDSLILSACIDDVPIETIEFDLTDFKIKQSRGLQNNPTKRNKQILSLLNDNIQSIIAIQNKCA